MSASSMSEEASAELASSADKALHETSVYVLFDSTLKVLAARGAGVRADRSMGRAHWSDDLKDPSSFWRCRT
jgi:hypothetical protein